MTEIEGRVAVVTGGGSGIGRSIALELANAGAAVAIADIIEDNALNVAQEITASGARAMGVYCDVTDRNSIKAMKARVRDTLGSASMIFANAGATSFDRLTDMSEADVDWIIHANLMGVVNCLMAFYPDMVKANDGHVFATSSAAGLLPAWVPYHAVYSGAKLGIVGMMLNLITEAAEHNVGVTVLCPGGVISGMRQNNARYRPSRFGGPGQGEVKIPEGFFQHATLHFRSAEEVGRLVVQAVRENQPMVITDGSMRPTFHETYVKLVENAFDFVDGFDLKTARAGIRYPCP